MSIVNLKARIVQYVCVCGTVEVDQWTRLGSVSRHQVPATSEFIQAVQEDRWRSSLWLRFSLIFQRRFVHCQL